MVLKTTIRGRAPVKYSSGYFWRAEVSEYNDTPSYGHILTSSSADGITWSSNSYALTAPPAGVPAQVASAFNGSRLVLNIFGSSAAYSDDFGVTWTLFAFPGGFSSTGGAHGVALFVFVNGSSEYVTSLDGIAWIIRVTGGLNINPYFFGFVKDRFASTYYGTGGSASSCNLVTFSSDGLSWIQQQLPSTTGLINPIQSLSTDGNKIYVLIPPIGSGATIEPPIIETTT